jgi:hypothetical protein
MHLGEDGDLAARQTLDHPHLPQRSRPVEPDPGEVPGDLGEFGLPTGSRYGEPVDVPVDVEVAVLDPQGVVDVDRHPLELAMEHRDVAHPVLEVVLEAREGVAVGDRLGVEQDDPADVHELLRCLQVEEARIQPTEAFHRDVS